MRFIPLLAILFLGSCLNKADNPHINEEPLARVYDSYLYPSDLEKLGFDISNDSLINQSDIVQDWVNEKLLLYKAEEQLSQNAALERKVEAYKESLMLHEYKSAIFAKNEVEVNEEDLNAYYEQHKSNFLLNDDFVSVRYVNLPPNTQEVNSLIEDLNLGNIPNFLMEQCEIAMGNCALEKAIWIEKSLVKEITRLPNYLVKENEKFKQFNLENSSIIVYRFEEIRTKSDEMPLDMVTDQISPIVLNNKKKEILVELENKLYVNAKNNQSVEIYN